ncbi:MAG: hypothetical protein QG604_500 [Candidatus Dependentiae bacterium]|nr:hypothetical protein [Candidatus Dependentiae bacterium]
MTQKPFLIGLFLLSLTSIITADTEPFSTLTTPDPRGPSYYQIADTGGAVRVATADGSGWINDASDIYALGGTYYVGYKGSIYKANYATSGPSAFICYIDTTHPESADAANWQESTQTKPAFHHYFKAAVSTPTLPPPPPSSSIKTLPLPSATPPAANIKIERRRTGREKNDVWYAYLTNPTTEAGYYVGDQNGNAVNTVVSIDQCGSDFYVTTDDTAVFISTSIADRRERQKKTIGIDMNTPLADGHLPEHTHAWGPPNEAARALMVDDSVSRSRSPSPEPTQRRPTTPPPAPPDDTDLSQPVPGFPDRRTDRNGYYVYQTTNGAFKIKHIITDADGLSSETRKVNTASAIYTRKYSSYYFVVIDQKVYSTPPSKSGTLELKGRTMRLEELLKSPTEKTKIFPMPA